MKNSKLLALSTLIAAAATAATMPEAAAGTTINGIEYSGTVYTWNCNTGDLAYGEYIPTTYDADSAEYIYNTTDAITTWSVVKGIFCLSSSEDDLSTIRFDSSYGENQTTPETFTFGPLAIAGIIVEDGTTGFSISTKSSGGTRNIYLGNFTDTAAYSTINEDFTLSNTGGANGSYIYIQGTQTWDIANEATFTLAAKNGFTVSGSLTIIGGGTANFSDGTVTSSANITISSGTVSGITTLTSTGTITVEENGSLDLFGTTVDLSEAITNSGTVTVNDSTVINLTDVLLSEGSEDTYVVISGGTISGWDSDTLTRDNFTVDGAALNTHSDVDVSTSGSVTITTAYLTWASSSGASWSDSVWTLSSTGNTDSFIDNDIVIFNSTNSGAATVSSDVTAASVTVTDTTTQTISVDSGATLTATNLTVDSGATLTLTGEGTVSVTNLTGGGTVSVSDSVTVSAENLTVDSDATLTLDGEGTVSVTNLETSGTVSVGESTTLDLTGTTLTGASYNISGSGTVKLALSESFSNDIILATNFSGTTYVTDGLFTLNSSTYGTNLTLGTGVQMQLDGGTTVTFSGTLTFEGDETSDNAAGSGNTNQVHLNGSSGNLTSLTFDENSIITGTAFDRRGIGTVTIYGNVNGLNTFLQTAGGGYTYFYGTYDNTIDIGAATISSGALYILDNATFDVDTLSVSVATTIDDSTVKVNTSGTMSGTVAITTVTAQGTNNASSATTDSTTASVATFEVGSGATLTISGVISGDSGSLTKTGDGTLTLSETNTYAGGTTVSAGTLQVSNASALGTGNVTVSGGTLSIDSDVTLSIATGTTLSVTGGTVSGAIELDGGTLSIDSGVTLSDISLSVVLSDTYLTSTTTSDDSSSTSSAAKSNTILLTAVADDDSGTTTTVYAIDGSGTLSVSEITISLDEELADEIASLSADATYTFSLAASTISGLDNVTITLDGLDTSSWTASLSDGTLTLTYTIPEPGSFGLLAGTLALAFAASRRRRSRKA